MKHARCIMVLLIGAALLLPGAAALLNPAAVYCDELDYTYTVESGENGDRGYCVVDKRILLKNSMTGSSYVEKWKLFPWR